MTKKIWAVAQQRDGKLHRSAKEIVAAGQRLAAAVGGEVEAVLLGQGLDGAAEELSRCALAAVRPVEHEKLAGYTPGAFVGALAALVEQESPDYVLFAHTYQTVDFLPRLAQRLKAALLPEAVSFESKEGGLVWRRPLFGGKLFSEVAIRGDGVALVSFQSGAYSADEMEVGAAPVAPLEVPDAAVTPDREILGVEEVAGEQVDLSQAPIIVAVGRGVGGADKMAAVESLAKKLGAEIGASRPVIDSEWLPRDRQIGSSGQTVAPKLYLALGISGAIQHLVGMKGSQVVVAVNKDPSAPIFGIARYGIVGDLHEVAPAIEKALEEGG